ncbi:Trafficking protein particle complex subunit 5 [Gracilariopsis chorda]|uniref:Trafficking protein particle complex subunit n=1 Tax=Gracilariopsis chorda TaxID=448386 RepID=A0A2V3IFJ0_9FLOR|nr:Trafficking protein particle complex subunit 5 [Gracilariopsis chorda]|eukprot:PXF40844.1 Trafficking protein particle complex subunit 5 [Gracilariopsis chorda]
MSLTQARGEVNMDAYLALFAELVSYCRDRVESVMALQEKLSQLGYRIGRRALDLIVAREKISKRDTRLLSILNFIALTLWTFLYGKQADSLKKVRDSELEYYIEEAEPLVNKYISVPADYGHFNCAAFSAGIINGVLNSAGFPAEVTAKVLARDNENESAAQGQPLTIYYIKFEPEVLEREQRLGT